MNAESNSAHITPAGGNVFADLGFGEQEAAALKIRSDRIISEKLAAVDHPRIQPDQTILRGDKT
jgi:hypothetical protein